MHFCLNVVSNTPLSSVDDLDTALHSFLFDIGYLQSDYSPKSSGADVGQSIPYRLFSECFLLESEKGWSAGECAKRLGASKPTIYRHLNKLKALDILEENFTEGKKGGRGEKEAEKEYRLRYGDFSTAWNFTESNITATLGHYRRAVDALSKAVSREGGLGGGAPQSSLIKDVGVADSRFEITLSNEHIALPDDAGFDESLARFLNIIGYMKTGADGMGGKKNAMSSVKKEPAYRIFADCFLKHDRGWSADEISAFVKTTKPTTYRHLKRIEAMGILDRYHLTDFSPPKKIYRLRYGDFARAWGFTEEYIKMAVQNYRKSVDHIHTLSEK